MCAGQGFDKRPVWPVSHNSKTYIGKKSNNLCENSRSFVGNKPSHEQYVSYTRWRSMPCMQIDKVRHDHGAGRPPPPFFIQIQRRLTGGDEVLNASFVDFHKAMQGKFSGAQC